MDDEYAQPEVLMFHMLPTELVVRIVVELNGGTINDDVEPKRGFLHPGYRGGRELNYFKISRDAMTFWQHTCKYLRKTYSVNGQIYNGLLSDNTPRAEMWTNPNTHMYGGGYQNDFHIQERHVPRHLYAGRAEEWMRMLCGGPQSTQEILAIEAAEQAKVAAKKGGKRKRRGAK
jgi:hypothetical protein